MIETITPAVCGSRRRQRIALLLFAAAAIAASAVLGALLGLAGSAVGTHGVVAVAAAAAALAALRELGLLRVPLPQARRQVPERWHMDLPLPLWASGYGAGLGLGVFTFQPVATFWVACVAALALGRPLAAAACFSLYGAARALMVVLPRRGLAEPGAAAERLARRRPALLRANAAACAACAAALALAASAGAVPLELGPGNQLDPAAAGSVLAYTQRDAGVGTEVVVRPAGEPARRVNGRSPALDGEFLAYADAGGVRVLRWRQGREVARVEGATRPALAWPWLAYRVDRFDGGKELWLRNLVTREVERVAHVGPFADLGRPALGGGRLAWHVATSNGSSIGLLDVRTGKRSVLARSKIALLAFPSVTDARAVWVEQRQRQSFLRLRRFDRRGTVTLARTWSLDELFWTTALAGRSAYVTRWYAAIGLTRLERLRA
jgi:hypothetical protein